MAETVTAVPQQRALNPFRRGSFNSAKIKSVIGRALGLIAALFAAQSVPVMLSQLPALHQPGAAILNGLLLLALGGLAVATFTSFHVTTATIGFAVVFVAALFVWPLIVADTAMLAGQAPWIWYLCTVATAAAAVGMLLPWAIVYTMAIPLLYGLLRSTPAGGNADPILAIFDGLYVAILGAVVLVIIVMLRHAASTVDHAQQTAMDAYARAVREHATELERAQVDAIVHDSVLATLLAAAGTRTQHEHFLAATMAAGALARLDEAGIAAAPLDAEVDLARVARRLRAAVQAFSAPVEVRSVRVAEQLLPLAVAEALYSAAVQAIVNSLQHAGDEADGLRRSVSVFGTENGGARIEITDNGRGFEPGVTNPERLGLRISIMERVRNVGGTVEVHSELGRGTAVALAWPGESAGSSVQ